MLSDPIVPSRLSRPFRRRSHSPVGARGVRCGARALRPFHPDPPRTVRRVQVVHPATGAPVDDALAACFRAPRSYTGEDLVELSTHGGLLVPAAAVAALWPPERGLPGRESSRAARCSMQARPAAGRGDRRPDRCRLAAQARRALHQLDRGLSTRLGGLRTELLELEALIAYEIDFPEEDEGPVAPERVERAWRTARDRIARLLDTAPEGSGCGKAPCS